MLGGLCTLSSEFELVVTDEAEVAAKACGEVTVKNNALQERSTPRRSAKRSLFCITVPF